MDELKSRTVYCWVPIDQYDLFQCLMACDEPLSLNEERRRISGKSGGPIAAKLSRLADRPMEAQDVNERSYPP